MHCHEIMAKVHYKKIWLGVSMALDKYCYYPPMTNYPYFVIRVEAHINDPPQEYFGFWGNIGSPNKFPSLVLVGCWDGGQPMSIEVSVIGHMGGKH